MGGKDVIYLKQQHSSTLQAADVQKRLKEMSDRRFLDANGQYDMSFKDMNGNNKVLSDPLLPPLPYNINGKYYLIFYGRFANTLQRVIFASASPNGTQLSTGGIYFVTLITSQLTLKL